MRIANVSGRLTLLSNGEGGKGRGVDVATASHGAFGPDVQSAYERWGDLVAWARTAGGEGVAFRPEQVGSPAPRPAQVFAIGVNYGAHAAEAGLATATSPVVFTKFPASVTGPFADVDLPRGSVDFEAELVVVIGRVAERVPAARAWEYVAGITMGQDLSERELQLSGPPPQQFCIAKSFKGFAPIGPWLVTPDELANPDDIEIGCSINGETMQRARTSEMIFSVPKLIAYLSSVLPLWPGDVIFTGTPAGIGWGRTPKRLLTPGDELVTFADGIGEMRNHFVATH
jgi:2-keto-4-pentenoate hydratase/2-oxohepta-3-ene-1,7-dioic acid hydratase in catechol pathway